jgi:hypothetical protein
MPDVVEESKISFHRDLPSARTADERERHFMSMVERSIPYFDKVIEEGDEPWFSSIEERRALYMRRYVKPAPADPAQNEPRLWLISAGTRISKWSAPGFDGLRFPSTPLILAATLIPDLTNSSRRATVSVSKASQTER